MAALSDLECEEGKIHNVDSATSIDWVLTKRPMIALYLISCLRIAYTAEAFFNRLCRLVRGTNLPDGEELARIVLSCCILLRSSLFLSPSIYSSSVIFLYGRCVAVLLQWLEKLAFLLAQLL